MEDKKVNDEKRSLLYSWPVIILALCIFWPVGVVLLIKRVSVDKKTAMAAGKFIGLLGIAAYGIAVIGLLCCIGEGLEGEDIIMILFFGAAGFALRRYAKSVATEAESIKQYLSIIVNGNVRQLDAIASTVGKTYDVVHQDVEKMIRKGYLKNAYINENIREIVLPSRTPVQQNNANVNVAMQPRVVSCSCCGANNTIYGSAGECEYCGSPLK